MSEIEAHGESARVSVSVVVRDIGYTRRVRKAHDDWGGRAVEVGCDGKLRGLRSGVEVSRKQRTFSVS